RGRGSHEGQARVKDELRQLLQFRQINLLAPDWPVKGGLDAIFCRNVMIYFDRPTQLQLLERLMPLLQPQGLFFAGHSESFGHAGHLVKLIGRTVYRHARVAP
ncbi:MAG: chemotaxis protein CheR, partial [Corallincola sp.]|nr:chemotaxis protein CheR [Corallincola sp.]